MVKYPWRKFSPFPILFLVNLNDVWQTTNHLSNHSLAYCINQTMYSVNILIVLFWDKFFSFLVFVIHRRKNVSILEQCIFLIISEYFIGYTIGIVIKSISHTYFQYWSYHIVLLIYAHKICNEHNNWNFDTPFL